MTDLNQAGRTGCDDANLVAPLGDRGLACFKSWDLRTQFRRRKQPLNGRIRTEPVRGQLFPQLPGSAKIVQGLLQLPREELSFL